MICRRLLCALLFTFSAVGGAIADQSRPSVVFAAASLKTVLDTIKTDYERHGRTVTISYAGSSALAKQIESGAPADVFISADQEWMDELKTKSLIKPGSDRTILGNRLVLIASAESTIELNIGTGFNLAAALGSGRLAVAETKSVPAGRYAKAALEHLGVWNSVSNALAETENVRAALALVARGEAPLGIVYATDALAEPHVKVVSEFPETSHPPIVYAIGVTANAADPAGAADFVKYLGGPEAKAHFAKAGFKTLD